MAFTLTFDTDNASFESEREAEVARILRDIANLVTLGRDYGHVHDVNGNVIGRFDVR